MNFNIVVILNLIPKKKHPYTINISGFNTCECNGTGGDSSSGMTEDERKMLNDVYNEVFKTIGTVSGSARFERDGQPRSITIRWSLSRKGETVIPEIVRIVDLTNRTTETLNRTDTYKTYTGITDNHSWRVELVYQGKTYPEGNNTVNANFYNTYQIFYGAAIAASTADITASTITGLNKLKRENANTTYNVDLFNTKFIFAYPSEFGTLRNLKDTNNFEYSGSMDTGVIDVPVTDGTFKGQTKQYRFYIMKDATTGMGFAFTATIG